MVTIKSVAPKRKIFDVVGYANISQRVRKSRDFRATELLN